MEATSLPPLALAGHSPRTAGIARGDSQRSRWRFGGTGSCIETAEGEEEPPLASPLVRLGASDSIAQREGFSTVKKSDSPAGQIRREKRKPRGGPACGLPSLEVKIRKLQKISKSSGLAGLLVVFYEYTKVYTRDWL